MLARIPLNDVMARSGASIWGATESKGKREIAIMALDSGTAFVDVSKPRCPLVLGVLPTATQRSAWREARALGDYAVIVFRTAFEKKVSVAETLTMEREPDGKWRVIGYSIR